MPPPSRVATCGVVSFSFGLPGTPTTWGLDGCSDLVRKAQYLELAQHELAILRYMLELRQDNVWSGAPGIRALVEVAEKLEEVDEADFALDALEIASFRCWWENPDQDTRNLVVNSATRMSRLVDDTRTLAILAQANPVKSGSVVIEKISRLAPDSSDPDAMYSIGMAANAVWAFDLGLAFISAAVEGLRYQGRLRRLLARALAAQ